MVWTGLGYGVLTIAGLFVLGGLVRLTWRVWRGCGGGTARGRARRPLPPFNVRNRAPHRIAAVRGRARRARPAVARQMGAGVRPESFATRFVSACGSSPRSRLMSGRARSRGPPAWRARDCVDDDWDTKDRRDVARGSNTAIFEHRVGRHRKTWYLITDWAPRRGSGARTSCRAAAGIRKASRRRPRSSSRASRAVW